MSTCRKEICVLDKFLHSKLFITRTHNTMEEPNFDGYHKIVESSQKWVTDESTNSLIKKTKWVVMEKVHGANFCIIIDGNKTIKCAKRREILPENEDFFGHKRILPELRPKIERLQEIILQNFPDTKHVFVFGEIFGGAYPHPDVPKVPDVQAVQTGIYYSPKIEFYCFDIMRGTNDGKKEFLDYDKALEYFKAATLFCAEPLMIGKYDEAVNYPIRFESTVPARLGFPTIKGNVAEGVVIKPIRNILVGTGKGTARAILKLKLDEFKEDAKFYQAEKWTNNNQPTNNNDVAAKELLSYEIPSLINAQRVASAISKVGQVDLKDKTKMRKLLDEVTKDVRDSLAESNEKEWNSLSQSDRDELFKDIVDQCKAFMTEYFLNNKK